MKKSNKGILGNWIVRNLLLAAAAVLAFVLLVSLLLGIITQHGKEISVPDFSNLSFRESRALANSVGLKVVAKDSVYVRRLKQGVVYEQSPKAGSMVKRGRKVQLTTNTYVAKEVPMPSLVGFSMRQAKSELQRNGLVLGRLTYVDDIATNNVLRQMYNGREISPGEMIVSGSTVNLVLGLSDTDNRTFVPNLEGRDYLRALDLIQENSLNVGKVRFDSSVKTYADSINAVVYFQNPGPSESAVGMGAEVSISLRPKE